jgi:hypothetical protein
LDLQTPAPGEAGEVDPETEDRVCELRFVQYKTMA